MEMRVGFFVGCVDTSIYSVWRGVWDNAATGHICHVSSVCFSSLPPTRAYPAFPLTLPLLFSCSPEPHQAGVSDLQRKYRIVARDWHRSDAQQDASLMFLYFKSLDGRAIGKFIRGLLDA